MEYWEVTKNRVPETLPIWQLHLPTQNVGGESLSDLSDYIDQFEPAATARTVPQGPSGVVTNAQLTTAINGPSNNSNAVLTLDTLFAGSPDAESLRQRFNELLLAQRR